MSDDENVKINDTDYLLSTNNLYKRDNNNIIKFQRTDNPDCFIAFEFDKFNSKVWIKFWKCTSEKGTGLVLMKDFLNYLLNSSQSIAINDFTVIQAYPKATAIPNPRITDRSQEKLIKFYTAIGFDKKENVGSEWGGGITKVSGTISNIINKIADYKSKNVGGKKRKTKKRRYTKRKK